MNNGPCEYCGAALPFGVDKRTRRVRSHHFQNCSMRPQREAVEQPRREWQGLTDDEISALFPSSLRSDYKPYSFARAIEQACKERNT